MSFRLLVILCLCPSALVAQPYSQSMAECAGLYQNAAQWVKTDASSGELLALAGQWAKAAVKQAKHERINDAETTILQHIDATTVEWEEKGPSAFMSQDFRDWTSYCRSFAKHMKLKVGPDA